MGDNQETAADGKQDSSTKTHSEAEDSPLPTAVVDRAEELTRRAREAIDENEAVAYREERKEITSEHGYRARIREDENDVLVLYPDEWIENGTVQLNAIEDLDRGFERPLEGPGDAEHWQAIETDNRELAAAVETAHGTVHGANAHAFADFMSNHYAKRIERATGEEVTEFRQEYFPRNAWPSDEQKDVVETSLEYVFECTETELPVWE